VYPFAVVITERGAIDAGEVEEFSRKAREAELAMPNMVVDLGRRGLGSSSAAAAYPAGVAPSAQRD
jgi:hypothetical protein